MTGMGSDGVKAMKDLKDAGAGDDIAEAEETCVVYGMPRAAVEMKAARDVLPVGDIPGKLIEKVNLYETKV